MDCNFECPVSTLKVDLGGSRTCLADVKNMLQGLRGVKNVFIDDQKEGKLKILGDANPMDLIGYLQQNGIKAQLLSYDNEPPRQSKAGSHSTKYHEDSDSDIDDYMAGHVQRSKIKNGGRKLPFGFGGSHFPPMPMPMPSYQQPYSGYNYPPPMPSYQQPYSGYHYPPPMPSYQQPYPQYGYRPPMRYPHAAYSRSSMYGRPMPGYGGYYGHGSSLPMYNPMVRYTSYADNYRYM